MSVKTAQSTLRVAVYSLVCYDGEKDPVSLAAQRDRYAKKLAENPNWVITEWFSDEITFDESEETPANFQRMLQRSWLFCPAEQSAPASQWPITLDSLRPTQESGPQRRSRC